MTTDERRKRASSEAADWWALLQTDDMTKAEREAFVDWLRDSQANISEMLQLYQVHGALQQFREWSDISTDRPAAEDRGNVVALPVASPPVPLHEVQQVLPRRGPRVRLFAVAAALAVVAVVTGILLPHLRGQWIETERGERRQVVLDDGSVVQVDPQTRLNVRFEKAQRRVVLSQGRAVFRVAKNPDRPFRVEAGGTIVRAVGTAFGVDRRAADLVVVTVSEGKVAVSAPKIQHLSERSPSAGERMELRASPERSAKAGEVLLTANEQITVAMTQATAPVRAVDSRRELAWAEGRLVFRNDSIASVILEFNRYNRVQLTVTDPALAARPITGVFDAANPEAFLAFLQNAAPVLIERDAGRSIVISSSVSH